MLTVLAPNYICICHTERKNGKTIHTAGDGDTAGKSECKSSKRKQARINL